MEQDVKENEVLLLRFKYHSFFDLNPKVRPRAEAVHLHRANLESARTSVEVVVCQEVSNQFMKFKGRRVEAWCDWNAPPVSLGHDRRRCTPISFK